MWMATGSQHEPVYPPESGYGHGDRRLEDIAYINGASNPDDSQNDLSRIANRYPQLLVPAQAGDVVFFGGHILHRSKTNFTTDRFRRQSSATTATRARSPSGVPIARPTMCTGQFHPPGHERLAHPGARR